MELTCLGKKKKYCLTWRSHNKKQLCYVKDDVQMPVLTPSSMMFSRPKLIQDEDFCEENPDMSKRARYLHRCKEVLWSRWSGEYLKSFSERHKAVLATGRELKSGRRAP